MQSPCINEFNLKNKMKQKTIAGLGLASAMLCGSFAWAQSAMSGHVMSNKGEAVPFAVIGVANSQLSTTADGSGLYRIAGLKPGRVIVTTRSVGYLDRVDTLLIDGSLEYNPVLVESNKQLDEVVVNATRVDNGSGMAYSNLDAASIQKQNTGQDAPYVLNQLTGVVVNSDAGNGVGYTGLRIRGSDGTRINVTVNGVPINDAESQGTFFVNMPDFVSGVNSVQVQRGVGASSNGAGAFGASINFQTNELRDKAYANVVSTAGSYATYRNTLAAGTGLMNNHFTFDARASHISSQGYIDRASSNLSAYYMAGAYYGKKTVIKFINFNGWEKTYQAWNLVNEDSIKKGNRTYNELGAYTDASGRRVFYKNQTDNYNQNNAQLHIIHQFSSRLSFNLTGHYTKGKGYYEEYKENQPFSKYLLADPGLTTADSMPVTSTNVIRRLWLDNDFAGGLFNLNYTATPRLSFVLGGGYNSYFGRHFGRLVWAQYASDSQYDHEYYHNTANKNDGNLYLKTNWRPLQALNVFVDLQVRRIDYRFLGPDNDFVDRTQTADFLFFNPKMGLSYTLNRAVNVYASAAVGNKEPNRNDFVENKPGSRPKHEEMLDIEAGARYTQKRLSASINLYTMQYRNQLVLNGQLNDVGASKRVNVDNSYRRGVEIEASWSLSRRLVLSGNLALSKNKILKFVEYVDSSNADYSVYTQHSTTHNNTDISFSPNVVGCGVLTVKPINGLEVALITKYVSRQYLDNTQKTARSINPYTTINLQLNYNFKTRVVPEIGFMLMAYNVLNASYETNGYTYSYYYDSAKLTTVNYLAPAAPVNFMGGINLKF